MHFDITAILAWISGAIPWLRSFSVWLESSLETVKTAQEIVKSSQELLKKDEGDANLAIEKVKANAELIRSYTWIGVIEFLVWLTKTVVFFIPVLFGINSYFKWLERWYEHRFTNRSGRQ